MSCSGSPSPSSPPLLALVTALFSSSHRLPACLSVVRCECNSHSTHTPSFCTNIDFSSLISLLSRFIWPITDETSKRQKTNKSLCPNHRPPLLPLCILLLLLLLLSSSPFFLHFSFFFSFHSITSSRSSLYLPLLPLFLIHTHSFLSS